MVMRKGAGRAPSTTVQVVVTGPASQGRRREPRPAPAWPPPRRAPASFFKGSTIFGLPLSRRMPSLRSMFLPGTMAAATRKRSRP